MQEDCFVVHCHSSLWSPLCAILKFDDDGGDGGSSCVVDGGSNNNKMTFINY